MKLLGIEKVRDGKYLKNYELTYENKENKIKKYEIVSRRDIKEPSELGAKSSGISIIATKGDRFLLLREFRMGVGREIYNLCAGMLEAGESVEDCVRRELYEETGLTLKQIKAVLPPSFAAVAISDVTTNIVFAEVEGELSDSHTSANEAIRADFYTSEQLQLLLETAEFSSRSQLAAYYFIQMQKKE